MHVERQTPVASSGGSSATTTPTDSAAAITDSITTTTTTNTISTTTNNNTTIATAGAGSRHILPRISVYSGITDRQTVQVLQQALSGQPGTTAARYLQQIYVAQQHHLMLQTTAALNTTPQLHSLGGTTMRQQGTLVVRHPTSNQNSSPSRQTGNAQTTISVTVPVTAAQLVSRSPAANGVPHTAVILRNAASNHVLTASQAQMYLRAQMLFLTPTAAINATKEASTQAATQQQTSGAQVQNLSMCRIQGPTPSPPSTTTTSSSSTTTPCATASAVQLQGLCPKKQTSGCNRLAAPVPGQLGSPGLQGKVWEEKEGPGPAADDDDDDDDEAPSERQRREGQVEVRGLMSVSQCLTTLTQHPLVSSARAHDVQMQPRLQQHAPTQQSQLTLLHTHSHRAQVVQTLQAMIQPRVQPQARPDPAPALAEPPAVPCGLPAAIFHSIVRPVTTTTSQEVLFPGEPVPVQDQNPHRPPASERSQPAQTTSCAAKPPQQQAAAGDFRNRRLTANSTNNTIPAAQQMMPLPVQAAADTVKLQPVNSDMSAYKTEGEEDAAACCGLNVNRPGGSPPVMTSGNGNNAPTVTGSAPQQQNGRGESKPPPRPAPPQATVKPHPILTHLIGGFVIQEGAEPFPVERPSFSIESLRKHKHYSERHNHSSEMEDLSSQELKKQQDEPMLTCELCGRVDFAYIFKGSKRFCSTVCAKRYNVGCSKRVGLFSNRRTAMENLKKQRTLNGTHRTSSLDSKKKVPPSHQKPVGGAVVSAGHLAHPAQGESSQCSDMASYESPLSPLSVSAAAAAAAASAAQRALHPATRGTAEHPELLSPLLSHHGFLAPCDPGQWNVEDVYEFICSLPGCLEIAEEFRSQEIDGQALLLLKEDHLMGTMNIKLGPALKIFAQISMLKDS